MVVGALTFNGDQARQLAGMVVRVSRQIHALGLAKPEARHEWARCDLR